MSDPTTPTPPVKTMTPAEQRVAIAIACGWTDCDINTYQRPPLLLGNKPTFQGGKVVSYLVDQRIPDYLNDLNAMHEAEKVCIYVDDEIDSDIIDTYLSELVMAADPGRSQSATASQRATALIKTLDLYTA